MKYLCYLLESRFGGSRYEYAVIDRERGQQFAVGYEISKEELQSSYVDPRSLRDARLVRDLWRRIKEESPGTFLDARARGWVTQSESVDE